MIKPKGELERAAALSNFQSSPAACTVGAGLFYRREIPFPGEKIATLQILRPESERLKQNLEGVCLHSYNDTVSANTGVIIERCFRGFPPLEGVQILSSVPSLPCDALRCHPAWITSHGQYTFCSPKRYPTYHSRVSTWCFSKSYQVSI